VNSRRSDWFFASTSCLSLSWFCVSLCFCVISSVFCLIASSLFATWCRTESHRHDLSTNTAWCYLHLELRNVDLKDSYPINWKTRLSWAFLCLSSDVRASLEKLISSVCAIQSSQ
jgi:hypothetical protein